MNKASASLSRKALLALRILKGLVFYALVPLLLLILLARPVGEAVRRDAGAACRIPLMALGAVGLNWLIYRILRRKGPPAPVIAHGVLCLLAVTLIQIAALPGTDPRITDLAYIAAGLTLTALILMSLWCAGRKSKAAHIAAVGFWIVLGVICLGMAYQVIRDVEGRCASRDTWITLGILAAVPLGLCVPRIRRLCRRAEARRRRTGLTAGLIVQIIGETALDRDDDPVTRDFVRVAYTVDGVPYETRTGITRFAMWKYGKVIFLGREIPVRYDPANPGDAAADKIDRRFFGRDQAGDGTVPDRNPEFRFQSSERDSVLDDLKNRC